MPLIQYLEQNAERPRRRHYHDSLFVQRQRRNTATTFDSTAGTATKRPQVHLVPEAPATGAYELKLPRTGTTRISSQCRSMTPDILRLNSGSDSTVPLTPFSAWSQTDSRLRSRSSMQRVRARTPDVLRINSPASDRRDVPLGHRAKTQDSEHHWSNGPMTMALYHKQLSTTGADQPYHDTEARLQPRMMTASLNRQVGFVQSRCTEPGRSPEPLSEDQTLQQNFNYLQLARSTQNTRESDTVPNKKFLWLNDRLCPTPGVATFVFPKKNRSNDVDEKTAAAAPSWWRGGCEYMNVRA